MTNPSALTISFLDKRPVSAARALSEMEASDAAAFLETAPARIVVKVVAHMNAWPASRLLDLMAAPAAASVVREMEFAAAAAILRLLDDAWATELMGFLPDKLRRDLETSLSFPDDTVGAQMTTAVLALTGEQTVADAFALAKASDKTRAETIFIVDDERRLMGAVSAARLLKASPGVALSAIADDAVEALSARARLISIANLEAWESHAELPVLSRKKQLIGALPRAAARSLSRPRGHSPAPEQGSILGAIAGAFFASAIGLGRLLADIEQSTISTGRGGKQS
ncbi:MAG: hypothetical protein AAFW81_00195 [Pseudomonadota bacterium]